MKRISWLLILLCGTIIFATSVPAVDDPDTAYNEADASVTVSLPLADASSLITPASASADTPRISAVEQICTSSQKSTTSNVVQPSHSLQQMLCTFLI